ncbi:MAG: hypothetical protein JWM58_3707 [Rhizobium sp.]|nr:hypothetical protein [Rhizobium sp.]
MNAMLTKYLKDFSAPQPAGPVGSDFLNSLPGAPLADLNFAVEPEPQVDIEAERQEAHEQGYREAAELYEGRHAEEIETLREMHALQLRELADTHESETIWMIHTRFHEMTLAISQTIAEQTLQVLLPVFEEEFCRRSIAHLAELVRTALSEAEVATVVIRGPERLYIRLKPLLEMDGVQTRFIESISPDISVEINDAVLVTRLASWTQALSEVTG